jgi:DNA-binding MarR family transcriptional regulator
MDETQRISELVDRLTRIAHGVQFAAGLNPTQWEALRFLKKANRYSSSPKALAEYLGTTKGTVSQTLINLESKGLISRSRCPDDGRAVKICLTEAGEDLLSHDPLVCVAKVTDQLPAEAQKALADGMDQMVRCLQKSLGLPEFGPCLSCDHFNESAGELHGSCRCELTGDTLQKKDCTRICAGFAPVQ